MLPSFIRDWEQGKERYLEGNPHDDVISEKGVPKFGGWIFNGFDTRKRGGFKQEVGADAVHHQSITDSIANQMIPQLQEISAYNAVPEFSSSEAVAKIEDLNVMAPDSIIQNVPIRYLSQCRPTNALRGRGKWATNQIDLMNEMASEYDSLAQYIIDNF